MKTSVILSLAVALALSLSACRRRNDPATMPTTDTVPYTDTAPTVTLPPLETNIPDPEVDTSMTTEATENDMARGRK